jgi:DNA replication protein DnaC
MSATPLALQQATILQHCKVLHLPTVGGQCGPLAEQAVRERHTHLGYLEALLAAEVDERERHAIARRLKDAHLPRVKTLDEIRLRSGVEGVRDPHPRARRRRLHCADRAGGVDRRLVGPARPIS